jgi:hypothetical protein
MVVLKKHLVLLSIISLIIRVDYSFSQEMKIEAGKNSGYILFQQKNDKRIYLESSYKTETFYMMVDSYSWFSALPEDWVVNKWNFKKTPYIYTTRDFNNKRQKVKLRLMEHIVVANSISASNFYVNPKKTLNTYGVGILGNDFLNDLNWKVDFGNGHLYYDTASFNLSHTTIKNDFKKTEFPFLTIQAGGIDHKVIIDLGASDELSIPAESNLGEWLIREYRLTPKSVKSGGANRLDVIDSHYTIALDSILLEGSVIRNVNITISRNTKVSYMGCGLLSRGTLYLNYRNKKQTTGQVGFAYTE